MPNFIEIGGLTRKQLVDLTRNDPATETRMSRVRSRVTYVTLPDRNRERERSDKTRKDFGVENITLKVRFPRYGHILRIDEEP